MKIRFRIASHGKLAWLAAHLIGWSSVFGRWTLSRISTALGDAADLLQPRFVLTSLALLLSFFLLPALKKEIYLPKSLFRQAIASGLLFVYLAVSSIWAPPNPYTQIKTLEVILLFFLVSILALSLVTSPLSSIDGFVKGVAFGCLVLAIAGIVGLASGSGGRLSSLGGGPNAFSRNCGIALLCLAVLSNRYRILRSPVIPVSLFSLTVLSGSRGGMIATTAGVLYYAISARLFTQLRALLSRGPVLVLGCAVALVVVRELEAFETAQRRLTTVSFGGQGDMSVGGLSIYSSGRGALFASAFQRGLANPLAGDGLGSFMASSGGSYPHNIFLELFAEAGLIGVIFAIVALWPLASKKNRQNPVRLGLVSVALLSLVAAMFSGDLYDSRNVWLFLLAASSIDTSRQYSRAWSTHTSAASPWRREARTQAARQG